MTFVDWFKTFGAPAATIVGTFIAAVLGARLGFSRTQLERAFDRKVSWHENMVTALAAYGEALTGIRDNAYEKGKRDMLATMKGKAAVDVQAHFQVAPKEHLWKEVAETEARVRSLARLSNVYCDDESAFFLQQLLTQPAGGATLATKHIADSDDSDEVPKIDGIGFGYRISSIAAEQRRVEADFRTLMKYETWFTRRTRRYKIHKISRKLKKQAAESTNSMTALKAGAK